MALGFFLSDLPCKLSLSTCLENFVNGFLLVLIMLCRMPITVYMADRNTKGGLIAICEYGQEYGKESPVRVLYHGFGHYEALQIHIEPSTPSKL
jgi:hypothetical protein